MQRQLLMIAITGQARFERHMKIRDMSPWKHVWTARNTSGAFFVDRGGFPPGLAASILGSAEWRVLTQGIVNVVSRVFERGVYLISYLPTTRIHVVCKKSSVCLL